MLWIVLLCGTSAHPQDATSGALRGEADGPDGQPIPNATVTLRNDITTRTLRTDREGRYIFASLPPGRYTLSIHADGFADDAPVPLTIVLGETFQLDTLLRIGITQSVTVQEEPTSPQGIFASPLDTTVRPDEVETLPINGRSLQDMALLSSSITANDAGESILSAAGIAAMQNIYTLDGAGNTRSFNGDQRGSRRLSLGNALGGIREFRILNSATDRTGIGASLQIVTHRASIRRGGSLFVQQRSNLFAATDPSAIVTRYNNGAPLTSFARPTDTRTQWGATLFGALPYTTRLLAHIAYEGEHRTFPAISSPQSRSFYSMSAKQVAVAQNRGVTIARQHEALNYLDSLTGTVHRHADEWSLLPRIDWNITNNASLAITWSHASRTSPAGLRSQTVVNRGTSSFGDYHISTDALIARWNQSLTARMTNSITFAFSRDIERQEAQAALPQEPHTGPNGFSPQVTIGSDFTYGKPNTLGRRRYPDEQRLQLAEAWTLATHAWVLQAGLSAASVSEKISSLNNEEGTYSYANTATPGYAGALVDWMTDWAFPSTAYPNGACPAIYATNHYFCFRSFTQSYGAQSIAFTTGEADAHAQARWQPVPSLALTLGARYEVFKLPSAQHPNPSLDALFGSFATTSQLPRDGNNLGPFAAIAWIRHNTIVRAGAGVNYGRVAGATVWTALTRTSLPGSVRSIHIAPQRIVDTACASAGFNFGFPSTYICAPSASTLRTSSAIMFANNFAMPSVGQADFSIEHQAGRFTLSLAYSGFAARSLPNSTDLNIVPSTKSALFRIQRSDNRGEAGVRNGDTFAIPLYTARVNSSFGPVTAILSNATASRHSITASAQRSLSKGWSFRAAWTYGKTLDFGQNHNALPLTNGQLDPFNIRYDRAASDLDRRHRIVVSAFVTSRVQGASLTAKALNNWTLAPLFSASSGRPYGYLISGGTSLDGGSESINGTGGLRYLPTVGPNTLRLPWSSNLNLRLARRIALYGDLRLQIYADSFNTLNTNNVNRVQERAFLVGDAANGATPLIYQDTATIAAEGLTTQPFGTTLGSGTILARQREFQFGIRMLW